ncbi:hypothetical protein TNCV_1853001 [Trichonephila clavipes]|nr:hypothetical protein TNCV_1853001 [Trichonephila clavipes]
MLLVGFEISLPARSCGLGATWVIAVVKSRCRNCGGGDRGRVAIYRPLMSWLECDLPNFAELKSYCVTCKVLKANDRRKIFLAHATMNFVGYRMTASDRWHQKTTTTTTR